MAQRLLTFLKTMAVRVLALAILLGAFQWVVNAESRAKMDDLHQELARVEELNLDLQDENVHLRLQVEAVRTDDRFLEQVARQEFGMIKQGETLYRFGPPRDPVTEKP